MFHFVFLMIDLRSLYLVIACFGTYVIFTIPMMIQNWLSFTLFFPNFYSFVIYVTVNSDVYKIVHKVFIDNPSIRSRECIWVSYFSKYHQILSSFKNCQYIHIFYLILPVTHVNKLNNCFGISLIEFITSHIKWANPEIKILLDL